VQILEATPLLEHVDVRAPLSRRAPATFIIGPDGSSPHVILRVTPRTHDDEVLAVLKQLAAA